MKLPKLSQKKSINSKFLKIKGATKIIGINIIKTK